ncbi:hypothetical protein NDU88_006097 [Pleurodeles waltl]|uniref:Uncharacterized protein n=1 Tax=Pleurodeles waltl TaxID=8319 RepID=A0AAV7WZ16_PLEWA|nr:hypothetical protein NDU88_006097 [Pleurodeles waltl]
MTLVGCGAVLYLATVVGLLVACIKVQKKYPGRRLLPSRLMPGRTVRRLSLLTNPNTSGSAPGKEPNGQIPQDQSTASEMQNGQAPEKIPPAALNSEESPAAQGIHMVMRDPSQEELVVSDQSNPHREDTSSLNACSEEVTIVEDSETFGDGNFHLNNKENVLTPPTDSQQDCNNTEPKISIPSQAQSTSDQMDQHDQEPLGRIQCTAEDSSPCPSDHLPENELVLNNQDQQHETTSTQITESKAQGQTSFPINGKPEVNHQQDDAPQDTPGTASDSDGSKTMLVCTPFTDCTEQHRILTALPPIALGSQDGAIASSASAPSNPELELMHKLYQDNDDTMATKPNQGEGTITPLKSSPKAMQHTSFHKQHPYLEESHCTDPNFGEFTTTLPDSTPCKSKHISFQNQKQCHEDSHLQTPCSNISSMLSASPANPRINGSPHSGDCHVPNAPSTPSESPASDEIHICQDLQPKNCDDVRTSPSNCQDVPPTASPFLMSHRRQMSFHTPIEYDEFVLPTGLYAGNTTSDQGALVPSHRKYLSDLEECHLHQEERLRTLRFRDPSWTPDTSSPSYRKLRSHRGQHLFFNDMPHSPAARSTEPETTYPGLDPRSRILFVHTRQSEPGPYETTVEPCYPDSILTCWEYSPWSENAEGSHPNHNPYYMDESSSLSSCSTEHETTVADPNLLTDSACSASTLRSHVNQEPFSQDLPPTPPSNTTKHDIVNPGLDPSSGILAVRSRLSESSPHENTADPRYTDFNPTRLKDVPALEDEEKGYREKGARFGKKIRTFECLHVQINSNVIWSSELGNLISELRNEQRGFRGRKEDGGRHILCNSAASIEREEEETFATLAANPLTHLQPAAPETAPGHSETCKGDGPPEQTGPGKPDHIEVSSAYPRPHTEREGAELR